MATPVKRNRRPYHAPRRAAAAEKTRKAILRAAKRRFERHGWPGTTIAAIADDAAVSPKTIEALFGTKAALLGTVVDYAIRGDTGKLPIIRRQSVRAMESAPDAPTMLERHAEHVVTINARSARIAWVIESAAGGDRQMATLWAQMTHNRRFGSRWAAQTLLTKPGARADLTLDEAAHDFMVTIDWGTYRTLAGELKLNTQQVKDWIRRYYQRMFLA